MPLNPADFLAGVVAVALVLAGWYFWKKTTRGG
jgi:hypothetical protein